MEASKRKSIDIYSLYIMLLTDIAGYSLLIPLVPYITESLGGTASQIGLLFGIYAATQFVGSYIMGSFSDRLGRHLFISISLLGQVIGCIGQSLAKNLWLFIGCRLFTGLFDCTLVIVQAYATLERAHYIAIVDAVYSAGYILGPVLGAFLSKISLRTALWTSSGLFALSFLINILFVKETYPKAIEKETLKKNIKTLIREGKTQEAELEKIALMNLTSRKETQTFKAHFSLTRLIFIVLIEEFCNKWVLASVDAIYGEFAEEKYGMDTFTYSMINAGCGLLNAIQQGVLYDFFVTKLNIPIATVTLIAAICYVVGYFIEAYSPTLILSATGVLLLFFGFGFCSPCAPTIVSTETSPEAQGQALSIVFFGGQLSQVLAPLLLGMLYETSHELSVSINCIAGVIIILLMIVILVLPGGKAAGKIPQEEYLKSLKEGNDLLSKKEVDKKNILAEGFNEYDIEFSANNQVTSYMMDGELHYITSADHSVSMGTGIRNISSRQLLVSEYDDQEEMYTSGTEDSALFEPPLIQYNVNISGSNSKRHMLEMMNTTESIHEPLLEEAENETK